MSVQLLRHSLLIQRRCIPVLRFSVYRLYSLHAVEVDGQTAVTDEGTSSANKQLAADDSPLYKPPKLYSSPTVKVDKSKKKKGKKKDGTQLKTSIARETESVELHLASLNASGTTPTLKDLERFRSARPPKPESRYYAKDYGSLVDKLCRSFSKDQLILFVHEYSKTSPMARTGRRKTDYAETIIEHWGWPTLADIEKAKRDRTEVSVEFIPVSRTELFLILGRDGADLLSLSREFNVHIALAPKPLSLRVEGVIQSLRRVAERIKLLKSTVITKAVSLPKHTHIRPELTEQISRRANAYVHISGSDSQIRIAALGVRDIERAERLVIRAAHEIHTSSIIPQLSYSSASALERSSLNALFASKYALYPHFSERDRPLALNAARTFRLRKVHNTLSRAAGSSVNPSDGLGSGHGTIYTHNRTPIELRTILLDSPLLDEELHLTRTVKASFGHMLFSELGDKKGRLTPDLDGYHRLSKVQDWIVDNNLRTSFIPGLPYSLTNSLPSGQRILHRLVYQAFPGSTSALSHLGDTDSASTSSLLHFMMFEVVLSEPPSVIPSRLADEEDREGDKTSRYSSLLPRLIRGVQRDLDIMLPDRHMDARFTATDSADIAEPEWPSILRTYASNLTKFAQGDGSATQPDPPLVLNENSLEYVLHGTSSVRQSTEPPPIQEVRPGTAAQIVTESILDLETSQKEARCEVTCADNSPDAWLHFLDVCDNLSASSYSVRSPLESILQPWS